MKKYRKREGVFVAEGPKVVGDLLRAGFCARCLYATQGWEWERQELPCQEVTEDELRKISFLQHPQQVLGVFETPVAQQVPSTPLSLALDGVQDPGNLGTIIRIADWFGIGTVYCSEDTADAWNPKVVQATMGSIARVNVVYTDLEKLIQDAQVPVYGTLLDGKNMYEQELTKEGIIIMGNEGNGISERIRKLITRRLLIPQYHVGAESLNVAIATAVVCAEFRRRS